LRLNNFSSSCFSDLLIFFHFHIFPTSHLLNFLFSYLPVFHVVNVRNYVKCQDLTPQPFFMGPTGNEMPGGFRPRPLHIAEMISFIVWNFPSDTLKILPAASGCRDANNAACATSPS